MGKANDHLNSSGSSIYNTISDVQRTEMYQHIEPDTHHLQELLLEWLEN